MPKHSHRPKLHALASLAACGILFAMASPAAARTFERCDPDGDHCVRIHCDADGDTCWHQSNYYSSAYYRHEGTWNCNGDSCHYVYNGFKWNPRHWDDTMVTPQHSDTDDHN